MFQTVRRCLFLRWNFRIRKFNHTFFVMFSETQTLEGVTSLIPNSNGKHFLMWDLENCTKEEAEKTLLDVQFKHNLPDVFIVSDKERSYRAWCYKLVDFRTFLKILLDTDYVDWNFFYYTVKRRKATLRVSNKKNRKKQQLVSVLESYSVSILDDELERVIYDTGVQKRGHSILLGDN